MKSWTETHHKQKKVANHYAETCFKKAREDHLGKYANFYFQLQALHVNGVELSEKQVKALRNITAYSIEQARRCALAKTRYNYDYQDKLDTVLNPIKNL